MTPSATGATSRGRWGAAALAALALLSGCSDSTEPTGLDTNPPSSPGSPAESPSESPPDDADLSLVVLGDSIATGSESGSGASFAQLYAMLISEQSGQTVSVDNLADPSETSSSLLSKLQSVDGVRAAVAGADIVTITVGGNDSDPFAEYSADLCGPGGDADACLAGYVPDLEADLDGIVTEIETLRDGAPTAVRITSPDYDPFIGVTEIVGVPPFPEDFGLGFYRQVAAAMTDAACRVARAHQADCADFFHVFNGANGDQPATAYLAEDHLHPSEQGRQAIADLLLAAGLDPLG